MRLSTFLIITNFLATWRPGVLEPRGIYLQNLKIRLCYLKAQLLSALTYPLNPKTKSIITIYANVAELMPPPSPLKCLLCSSWNGRKTCFLIVIDLNLSKLQDCTIRPLINVHWNKITMFILQLNNIQLSTFSHLSQISNINYNI